MVFTNLGVALHRMGAFEPAFSSLKVGRDYFRAQANRPGEAHVCDCLAAIYQEQGRVEEAEQAWRYALKLYDGIVNPAFADLRRSGRADILSKLERLGRPVDGTA
jgi:tetratricopeptide (TPR) repeat protein